MADPGPLIPRPAVTLIALLITLGMLANIYFDAHSKDYSGDKTTLILAALIAGILGFELFRRGNGSGGGDQP